MIFLFMLESTSLPVFGSSSTTHILTWLVLHSEQVPSFSLMFVTCWVLTMLLCKHFLVNFNSFVSDCFYVFIQSRTWIWEPGSERSGGLWGLRVWWNRFQMIPEQISEILRNHQEMIWWNLRSQEIHEEKEKLEGESPNQSWSWQAASAKYNLRTQKYGETLQNRFKTTESFLGCESEFDE